MTWPTRDQVAAPPVAPVLPWPERAPSVPEAYVPAHMLNDPACAEQLGNVVALLRGEKGDVGLRGEHGSTVTLTAGQDLNGHRALAEVSPGVVVHADPNNVDHAELFVGVGLTASLTGAPVSVGIADSISDPSFNWVPFKPVFVGLLGVLTQAIPLAPMLWSICVGVATSATTIRLEFEPPIYLES